MVMEGEEDEGGAGEGVSVGFDGEGGGDRSVARRERMERKRRRAVAKQTRDDEKTSSFGECGGETRLVLRGVADEALAVRERDIGRRRPVALVVRDDLDAGGRGREGGRRAGQSSGRVGGRRTKKMMSRVASRTERARYAAAARFRRDRARRIDSKATMETESGIRRGRVAPRARDRARVARDSWRRDPRDLGVSAEKSRARARRPEDAPVVLPHADAGVRRSEVDPDGGSFNLSAHVE